MMIDIDENDKYRRLFNNSWKFSLLRMSQSRSQPDYSRYQWVAKVQVYGVRRTHSAMYAVAKHPGNSACFDEHVDIRKEQDVLWFEVPEQHIEDMDVTLG